MLPERSLRTAKYEWTIAVAASNENDEIADFSSRGDEVDITGPGVNVESTWIDSGYREASGTSMAAPHVAGTAALVIGRNGGEWNTDQIRDLLVDTAENLGHDSTAQGAGLVRADWALGLEAEPAETGTLTGTVTEAGTEDGIEGADLKSVKSELFLDGDLKDSETTSVSGIEAEGEHNLRNRERAPKKYEVTLTVKDRDGNTVVSEPEKIEL